MDRPVDLGAQVDRADPVGQPGLADLGVAPAAVREVPAEGLGVDQEAAPVAVLARPAGQDAGGSDGVFFFGSSGGLKSRPATTARQALLDHGPHDRVMKHWA